MGYVRQARHSWIEAKTLSGIIWVILYDTWPPNKEDDTGLRWDKPKQVLLYQIGLEGEWGI